ncbi:hypothetical protein [Amphibacillus sediminis]|uniref:hypothetical protein n=1 Tax=Amphibacillus sediminis TaxID=360185 RepID=UPI00082CFF5C|nr:hypothetical protein [Amphibacillus sediminis]
MWEIEHMLHFKNEPILKGFVQFGFHDYQGDRYALNFDQGWFGKVKQNHLEWSFGACEPKDSLKHYQADISEPTYLTGMKDGTIILVSSGNRKVYKLQPSKMVLDLIIDGKTIGLKDIGNCEFDKHGHLWINEITGCRVWQFNIDGQLLNCLGDGIAGFQTDTVGYNEVRFNWIYDLRRGPDGHIYVLDSRNYAVRKIDVDQQQIELIAGTGQPGYHGDGGPALQARFGGDHKSEFDGPWSLVLDEEGNIYVGDTQNHVVRFIDSRKQVITTLAGDPNLETEVNDLHQAKLDQLRLPLICSLDYYNGRLFIPEWDGDLIILKKQALNHKVD